MTRPSIAVLALAIAGCDVPNPPRSTGGAHFDAATRKDAAGRDAGAPDGEVTKCLRGFVVAESDYMSTNVALLAPDGTVKSSEFASSATASVGLTAPLSGDMVLPTEPSTGSSLVLIDESPASRIDWADIRSASMTSLDVKTGFYSDPQDYLAVSATKAYVPRHGQNSDPGTTSFDEGSDVLIVDPSAPSITGSIDLRPALGSDYPSALPRPGHVVRVRNRAYVLLEILDADTNQTASEPSRIVAIDLATDAVVETLVLDGFLDCVGFARSPDDQELAVLCSSNPIQPSHPLDGSGIVIVGIGAGEGGALGVKRSFRAADLGSTPVYFFGDYAAPGVLLYTTYGMLDATTGATIAKDTLVRLDLSSGESEILLSGDPFTLGSVACDAACGVCFVADAGTNGGVVHRYDVTSDGQLVNASAIKVETRIGLPPRYIGKF